MPLSIGTMEWRINDRLKKRGLNLDGEHARVGVLSLAVATGVVNEVLSSAKVVVPTHAGGTYPVTGLSASGMSAKIKASLVSQGFVYGGFSRANVINEAISSAVTSEILGKCTVTIPYDGSGKFSIVGMDMTALTLAIEAELSSHGFNLGSADSGLMASSVSYGVTTTMNVDGVVNGGFAGGGVFPVL